VETPRPLDRRTVAAVALLLTGVLVSGEILYPRLVVIRLDESQSVPMHWWLLVSLPVIVAAVATGACIVHDRFGLCWVSA
jgi:hypothetical protein